MRLLLYTTVRLFLAAPGDRRSSHPSVDSFGQAVFILAILLMFSLHSSVDAATLPSGFTETLVASGLSSPTAMAFAPDGRLFVCEQGGNLRVIKNGSLLPDPFLTITVNSAGERGLLGIVFDPDFANNKFLYIYYTATTPAIHNRVSRFTANGDVAVAGSEVPILDLNNLSGAINHNGGAMHFGPDGKLYIAVGENATASNAQTLSNLLGKMLRINADGSIPEDNPFYNTATGNNRAIWALGLRNPYTFAFQPGTGRMFINDVGQNTWEEINDGIAGANYGWPTCEGACSNSNFRNPLFQYGHGSGSTTGCAITGGAFYNPPTQQFPGDYVGKYFFAEFCSGWIRRLDPANNTATGFATGISNPVDLRVASDGSLYYLARGAGAVFKVQYPAGQVPPSITMHPANQTVAVGQSATFSVSATGSTPLAYQWQRNGVNIPGATSSSYTTGPVAASDNGAQFRCVVSNAFGSVTSNSATLTVTANTAPTATITSPASGTRYSAGETINYAGTGSDAEDGALPAGAFTWQVDFHHDNHVHPFIPATSGATSGSFTIPTVGETSANVWYRIYLTVRDSGGSTHTTFRDVLPRTVTLTLTTNPAGLQLTLDGQPVTTPYSETNVVGMQRTLGVISPQTVNNVIYQFTAWSDGGAATHNINVPGSNTTYTATFNQAANPGDVLISEFRFRGPFPSSNPNNTNGALDEFIDLYNNTDTSIVVGDLDGLGGWSLVAADSGNGFTVVTIPRGTTLPARGHYLIAFLNGFSGEGYSLSASAAPDLTYDLNLPDGGGIALFRTAAPANRTLANRLDAVGFSSVSNELFREGGGLAPSGGITADREFSFVRKLTRGLPQDTNNNANDFLLISTTGEMLSGMPSALGAPGPENLASPIQRNVQIRASLLDPAQSPAAAANRRRYGCNDSDRPAPCDPNISPLGYLSIRRTYTNNTGQPVTRLRFRIVDISTSPEGTGPGGNNIADLRAVSRSGSFITAEQSPITLQPFTVQGLTLEQPPNQPLGGGFNASLAAPTVTLQSPLAAADDPNTAAKENAINVEFLLGIVQTGNFRFFVNVEALP